MVPPTGERVAKVTSGRRGMPMLTVDWQTVENLAVIQCTVEEIAYALGVSKETLYNEHNREKLALALERGRAIGRESIRRAQYKMALGDPGFTGNEELPPRPPTPPDKTMLIWLGKIYLGQRETIAMPEPQPMQGEAIEPGRRVITIRVRNSEGVE